MYYRKTAIFLRNMLAISIVTLAIYFFFTVGIMSAWGFYSASNTFVECIDNSFSVKLEKERREVWGQLYRAALNVAQKIVIKALF